MQLTPRLAAVAAFIPPGARVADIGTDHALLPVYLVENKKLPGVIATDLNEKPYLAACRQVQASNAGHSVEVRKGDGLEAIRPGEVDVIVIAGMGGNTIIGILERSPAVLAGVSRLVLQPMADPGPLRIWLARNGWRLVDEELVKEMDRFYVIMAAEPGNDTQGDSLLQEIGPLIVRKSSPVLIEYLEKIREDYQRVLSGLARSRTEESMEKAVEMTKKLAGIKELILRCRQSAEKFSR
ncbi:MAG: tRNA (adenine(22)-N(1))-methyltransferase [Bacillota bacterium]